MIPSLKTIRPTRGLPIERLREQGCQGKISILRDYAAMLRKRIELQAVMRFEAGMGRQASAQLAVVRAGPVFPLVMLSHNVDR